VVTDLLLGRVVLLGRRRPLLSKIVRKVMLAFIGQMVGVLVGAIGRGWVVHLAILLVRIFILVLRMHLKLFRM